jgi:hypothetical protein
MTNVDIPGGYLCTKLAGITGITDFNKTPFFDECELYLYIFLPENITGCGNFQVIFSAGWSSL